MPEPFLPASQPFSSALSVFFTLCASTIKKLVKALRPSFLRASPTDFFLGSLQGAHSAPIGLAPLGEIRVDRDPVGKPFREHTPLTAALEQIQNGVEDFKLIHGARLGALAHALQQGTDQLELLPADIAWIRLSWLHSPELACRW